MRLPRLISTLVTAAVLTATALPSSAAAPLGTAITYQGQLSFNGAAVTAACDFQAALYDAATAGAQIGTTQTVNAALVTNGLFALNLDFGAGAFDGAARWLAVAVRCPAGAGAFTVLDPRQPLNPSPYALRAGSAAQADTATAAASVPWSGVTGVPAGLGPYSAGAGLALSGTTFDVVTATIQARVTGACAVGEYVRAVNADGTVVCGTDANTGGTLTGVTAGAGLAGGGTTGNVTVSVVTSTIQQRVTGSCVTGQMITAIAADGTVSCAADQNTAYSAGAGLALTGTTFSADGTLARVSAITPTVATAGFLTSTLADATYQKRVTGSCTAGDKVTAVNADGTVVCGADANTTYTAGSGLTLTGGAFAVQFAGSGVAATAARSDHTHDAAGIVSGTLADARIPATIARVTDITPTVQAAGFITSTLADARYTYTAGAGLSLAGTTFSVPANGITSTMLASGAVGAAQVVSSAVQLRVVNTCTAGQYVQAVNADGAVVCGTDANSGTITGVTAGTGLTGGGITGTVAISLTTAYQLPQACTAGQAVVSDGAGGWVCQTVSIPSGTIAFFGQAACPAGWTEVTALRGRAVVGLPAAGTVSGTVGTALTNQAANNVTLSVANLPAHTHDVNPASTVLSMNSVGNHTHDVNPASTALSMNPVGNHTHDVDPAAAALSSTGIGSHSHNFKYDVLAVAAGTGATVRSVNGAGAQTYTLDTQGPWTPSGTVDIANTTSTAAGGFTPSGTVDIANTTSTAAGGFTPSGTVDIANTTSTATGSGTAVDVTMPYIQLLACTKN